MHFYLLLASSPTYDKVKEEKKATYLMKFTPTHQPRHAIPRLILLKANDALLLIPLGINAIFLRGSERKHAARRVAEPVRRALACIAHAARALRGQASR
jgi:hypothetical protein